MGHGVLMIKPGHDARARSRVLSLTFSIFRTPPNNGKALHKLDMLDGTVSGTPPLQSRQAMREWIDICTREFESLKTRSAAGYDTFLDPYGATNVGEFFAVATEYFFDKPVAMEEGHGELYSILSDFYGQDPAGRARTAKGEPGQPTHPQWMSTSTHPHHPHLQHPDGPTN